MPPDSVASQWYMQAHCTHYWYITFDTARTNKKERVTVALYSRIERYLHH